MVDMQTWLGIQQLYADYASAVDSGQWNLWPQIPLTTVYRTGVIGIKLLDAQPSLHIDHDQLSITFRQYSYIPRMSVSVTM